MGTFGRIHDLPLMSPFEPTTTSNRQWRDSCETPIMTVNGDGSWHLHASTPRADIVAEFSLSLARRDRGQLFGVVEVDV